MPPPEFTLRARFIFPVDTPPIESGTIRIASERIVSVGEGQGEVDLDLGNSAVVPGFVNAHTHLELSTLRASELGGGGFVPWLRRVIATRAAQSPAEVAHAVSRGIDASLAAGTTLIGDISTSGRSWKELLRSPLRAVVFAELLGLKVDRASQTTHAARQFLEWAYPPTESSGTEPVIEAADAALASCEFPDGSPLAPPLPPVPRPCTRRLTASLSPHAPYSAHPLLYDWAAAWSMKAKVPLCTHLAETEEELQLLRSGNGPLRDFLVSLGAWSNDWEPPGSSPAQWITGQQTSQASWILAHGNYLCESEIAQLAAHNKSGHFQCAIAYCPRTHNYFGHRCHPHKKIRAAGITVCLGTDSLASSPSLSILDEMRFVRRRDSSLDGPALLRMGTIAGATALRMEQDCGSLAPGKYADLAVVRLPKVEGADPYDLLLQSHEPVVRTMIGGRWAYQRR